MPEDRVCTNVHQISVDPDSTHAGDTRCVHVLFKEACDRLVPRQDYLKECNSTAMSAGLNRRDLSLDSESVPNFPRGRQRSALCDDVR